MGKRILGVVFLLLAILVSISVVWAIPNNIARFTDTSTNYDLGYALGNLAMTLILALVAFFLWKFGLRWAQKS